jgi:hypothetical protein
MAAQSDQSEGQFVGPSSLEWRGAHRWHAESRIWSSANEHIDLWVALLHTLGLDPAPLLTGTFCTDFEGDQWTLARIAPTDIWACYGIAVQELCVWRPLLAHVVEQLDRGNVVIVEVDAFHLPDMVGSSYQREHAKAIIAATGYDRRTHTLRYIHGATGAEVGGDDLDALMTAGIGSAQLPPTTQVVRLDRMTSRSERELSVIATALARWHGTRLPHHNPVRSFSDALRAQGAWLAGGDDEHYQRWAFATLQQCGAAFELAGDVCEWLAVHGATVDQATPHYRDLSRAARTLHQKLVRVPQSGRMPDVTEQMDEMCAMWDRATGVIRRTYGLSTRASGH